MPLYPNVFAILIIALAAAGCEDANLPLKSGVNSTINGMYLVSGVDPSAAPPGAELRIFGTGFDPDINVKIGKHNLEILRRQGASEVVVRVPNEKPGIALIELSQRGDLSSLNFVLLSGDGFPLTAGVDPAAMCKGDKFYNMNGELLEGIRDCTALTDQQTDSPEKQATTSENSSESKPVETAIPETKLPECNTDGQIKCIANILFPAVMVTGLAEMVPTGKIVGGVTGIYTPDFPDASNVRAADTVNNSPGLLIDCDGNLMKGCVTTTAYQSGDFSNLRPENIRNTVTIAGVSGGYPSSSYRLENDTATTDLPALNNTLTPGTYEFFNSAGIRLSGQVADATFVSGNSTVVQSSPAGIFREVTIQGDPGLIPGNIRAGSVILGKSGSYSGSSYISCGLDGETSCIASPLYPAVDKTLRAKPNNIRVGVTIAGVIGTFAGGVTSSFSHPQGGDDMILAGSNTNIEFNAFVTPDFLPDHYDLYYKQGNNAGCTANPTNSGWTGIAVNTTTTDPQSTGFSHSFSTPSAGSFYFCLVLFDSNTALEYFQVSDVLSVGLGQGPCLSEAGKFKSRNGGCELAGTSRKSNGLVLSMVAPAPMNFQTATNYCASLTQSGISGWRLPSLQELHDINAEQARQSSFVDLGLTVANTRFWTLSHPDWCGEHRTGFISTAASTTNVINTGSAVVICVRGIPATDIDCP